MMVTVSVQSALARLLARQAVAHHLREKGQQQRGDRDERSKRAIQKPARSR